MMHRQETVECLKKFNARRKLKVGRLLVVAPSGDCFFHNRTHMRANFSAGQVLETNYGLYWMEPGGPSHGGNEAWARNLRERRGGIKIQDKPINSLI